MIITYDSIITSYGSMIISCDLLIDAEFFMYSAVS